MKHRKYKFQWSAIHPFGNFILKRRIGHLQVVFKIVCAKIVKKPFDGYIPPLSECNTRILQSLTFSPKALNVLNVSRMSVLCFRGYNETQLLKSFMRMKNYCAPPNKILFIGTHISEWTSYNLCRHLSEVCSVGIGFLQAIPAIQFAQSKAWILFYIMSLTDHFLTKFEMSLGCIWASRYCKSWILDFKATPGPKSKEEQHLKM